MTNGERLLSGSFLRLWRADAVSGLGTYITLFALQTLVVLTLHGSAGDVGWLNAARWLPALVLGLVVGAVVDGRQRLPLMVSTDLLQAVLLLSIPLSWWLDWLSLPVLLVIVFGQGCLAVINMAASMSFLPRLVAPEQLQPAHALTDGADAVSSMAGPALGGLMVTVVSAPVAVLVDSLTYLYSAFTLRGIDIDEPAPRVGVTAKQLAQDVLHGVRWAYGGSGLRVLALSTHAWFVAHAIVGVALAPYVLRTLDLTAFQFGMVGAAGGVGAILGATVTTWVGRRLGTGRTIIACDFINAVGVVILLLAGQGMGSAATIAVVMAGQGVYGIAMGMSNSHETSYRQLVTPDELQARTNTTLRSLNRAVIVVVAPLAGILADTWGIRPMLLLAAAIFALVAIALGVSPFRKVRAPVG